MTDLQTLIAFLTEQFKLVIYEIYCLPSNFFKSIFELQLSLVDFFYSFFPPINFGSLTSLINDSGFLFLADIFQINEGFTIVFGATMSRFFLSFFPFFK